MNSTPFRSARRLPVPPDSACPPPPAGCAGAPGSVPGGVRQAPGRRARTLWLGL
ncbi:efflux transporter periplasmic adaptor subunit, partial [Paracidovorax avenae]